MYHYELLNFEKRKYFEKSRRILVFNNDQKKFWTKRNQLSNVEYLDVITPNEKNLLNVETNKFRTSRNLVFGYIGRISKEKNIEDMLRLLDFLINVKKQKCELYILGVGNDLYVNTILKMINSLNLTQYVKFENSVIPPMETHHFFEKIDIFLVTSLHEGGPITSLQAAAAGRIVLGYEVGAMKDRFSQISNTFHQNFDELCIAALSLTNSSISEKIKFGKLYRQLYKEQLNNKIKVDDLLKLLYVED